MPLGFPPLWQIWQQPATGYQITACEGPQCGEEGRGRVTSHSCDTSTRPVFSQPLLTQVLTGWQDELTPLTN